MRQAVVLGAGGYVGAELIRLLVGHPEFELSHACSQTHAGEKVNDVYPHLNVDIAYCDPTEASITKGTLVFSALPHGQAANTLAECASKGATIVDISADFRHTDPAVYKSIYGSDHPQIDLLDQFYCGLPELTPGVPGKHISCPGCFATCITLACAPLAALGVNQFCVSAVTGSTGSGAQPKEGTHHPNRNGGMWAYEPLKHRHLPEIETMLGRLQGAGQPHVNFVPHSGPFSRGIHATIFAERNQKILEHYQSFYANAPFVSVSGKMPNLRQVVGTNRAAIGVAQQGKQVAVTCVIDNLVKGAAGGAVQWMNRICGLDETTGLTTQGLGWA